MQIDLNAQHDYAKDKDGPILAQTARRSTARVTLCARHFFRFFRNFSYRLYRRYKSTRYKSEEAESIESIRENDQTDIDLDVHEMTRFNSEPGS